MSQAEWDALAALIGVANTTALHGPRPSGGAGGLQAGGGNPVSVETGNVSTTPPPTTPPATTPASAADIPPAGFTLVGPGIAQGKSSVTGQIITLKYNSKESYNLVTNEFVPAGWSLAGGTGQPDKGNTTVIQPPSTGGIKMSEADIKAQGFKPLGGGVWYKDDPASGIRIFLNEDTTRGERGWFTQSRGEIPKAAGKKLTAKEERLKAYEDAARARGQSVTPQTTAGAGGGAVAGGTTQTTTSPPAGGLTRAPGEATYPAQLAEGGAYLPLNQGRFTPVTPGGTPVIHAGAGRPANVPEDAYFAGYDAAGGAQYYSEGTDTSIGVGGMAQGNPNASAMQARQTIAALGGNPYAGSDDEAILVAQRMVVDRERRIASGDELAVSNAPLGHGGWIGGSPVYYGTAAPPAKTVVPGTDPYGPEGPYSYGSGAYGIGAYGSYNVPGMTTQTFNVHGPTGPQRIVYGWGGPTQPPSAQAGQPSATTQALSRQFGQNWMGGEIPEWMQDEEIPEMAAGGVVRRPGMAIVGERGPEAAYLPQGATVVPLGRGQPAPFALRPQEQYMNMMPPPAPRPFYSPPVPKPAGGEWVNYDVMSPPAPSVIVGPPVPRPEGEWNQNYGQYGQMQAAGMATPAVGQEYVQNYGQYGQAPAAGMYDTNAQLQNFVKLILQGAEMRRKRPRAIVGAATQAYAV